jgi:hypothetical protein
VGKPDGLVQEVLIAVKGGKYASAYKANKGLDLPKSSFYRLTAGGKTRAQGHESQLATNPFDCR